MPGAKKKLNGHDYRSSEFEDACRHLDETIGHVGMIAASLSDDGNVTSAWDDVHARLSAIYATMEKLAR